VALGLHALRWTCLPETLHARQYPLPRSVRSALRTRLIDAVNLVHRLCGVFKPGEAGCRESVPKQREKGEDAGGIHFHAPVFAAMSFARSSRPNSATNASTAAAARSARKIEEKSLSALMSGN